MRKIIIKILNILVKSKYIIFILIFMLIAICLNYYLILIKF